MKVTCKCETCNGTGRCHTCDGEGEVIEEQTIENFTIPSGHPEADELRNLKDDMKRAQFHLERLIALNPIAKVSYQQHFKEVRDLLESKVAKLLKAKT